MAAKKDIEKKVKLREFQRSVNQLLSTEDRDYLFYALREYNTYKSVAKLMLALNSCLDTPEKLDLLPYVRDLIPKHDKRKFDSLAPYTKMAHPVTVQLEQNPSVKGKNGESVTRASTRVVNLQRPPGTPLGFSIRGGIEHNLGIYLSHVDSLSLAEKAGLTVGDQIVNVNGIDFRRVSHSSAVLVLKSHDNLRIEVKNRGIMPGQVVDRNSILWVDSSGNPVEESDNFPESPLLEKREAEVSGGRLLTSSQGRKVVLHAQKNKDLGFSVRGGQEYGLGIYVSAVDNGSPAEEAGLQVGDQVMDVNGHSFVSIIHQEAVHILRSYKNLILTIKSLGRIPKLASETNVPKTTVPKGMIAAVGTETHPSSPHSRKRASSLLKSLKSKLSTHSEEEEEEEEEEEQEKRSHTLVQEDMHETKPKSSLQRSHSMKTASLDRRRFASSSNAADRLDLARTTTESHQYISTSAGSSPVLPRTFPRKHMSISPLATHQARATSTPVPGPDGRLKVTPKFFEKGVGTQVMLSSTTSSLAKELLFDKARRLLEDNDVESLRENTQQYEMHGGVEAFAQFLISLLDTPEKINLLTEVRSIISPSDIIHFDQIVSPQEVKILQQTHSSDTDEDSSDDDIDGAQNYQMVLKAIKNHNGNEGLRKTHPELPTRKTHRPNLGAFGNSKAQSLLERVTETMSEPDLIGLQSKESFLAWNDGYEKEIKIKSGSMSALPTTPKVYGDNKDDITPQPSLPSRNPVIMDIAKNADYLGMSVEGGLERGDQKIRVRDIREGGVIAKDGFIQRGFELVEVDGKRLRGKSESEARHMLAEAFNSTNQTMTFIVIPNNY